VDSTQRSLVIECQKQRSLPSRSGGIAIAWMIPVSSVARHSFDLSLAKEAVVSVVGVARSTRRSFDSDDTPRRCRNGCQPSRAERGSVWLIILVASWDNKRAMRFTQVGFLSQNW
jgi:hypothetical protein